MLTPPLFVLLLGGQLAVGALIAASCQPWALLFGPCLIGSVFCAFILSVSPPAANMKRRLTASFLIVSLALAPILGFVYTDLRLPRPAANDLRRFAGSSVYFEGVVALALPLKSGKQARFICTALNAQKKKRGQARQKCQGTTLLFLPGSCPVLESMKRKTHFLCLCRVIPVDDLEKRGRGGYANYLKRMGVYSICYLNRQESLQIVPEPSGVSADSDWKEVVGVSVEAWRAKLITAHTGNLGPVIGSLLTAMVLGEKAVGLDSQLLNSFRDVGLSHVLAASGFNLTVVTLSTSWVCRAACLPALPTSCLSFVMMLVFVLFAGNSSSVVRASLMCSLAILASCMGRRPNPSGLLGAALVISVLVDPLSVADPGFQLSYAAVLGIIFLVSPISGLAEKSIDRRWLRWTVDGLVTVLIAQSCVLPLQLYYFKQMGLLFLPANLLASLVVTPVTVAGFAASLILLCCPDGTMFAPPFLWCAGILDWMAALPLHLLVYAVNCLSSCRWAVLSVPPVSVWQVVLYYLVFAVVSIGWLRRLKQPSIKRPLMCCRGERPSAGDDSPRLDAGGMPGQCDSRSYF